MKRVLLLTTCTPDDRKTLAAARALGRDDWEVHVASNAHKGQAGFSRYVVQRHILPHPANGIQNYLEKLEALVARGGYRVILPMNDYTSLSLVESELSQKVGIPLPEKSNLRRAGNKADIMDLAEELGIGIPTTVRASNTEELNSAVAEIGYPCVVKLNRGSGSVGMSILQTPTDLNRSTLFANESPGMAFDRMNLLVQEYIPGDVFDVCLLFDRGQCCGGLVQRRVRMYPPGAGVGVIVETTNRPELLEQSIALLKALDWHGPAQVEFKIDERDGSVRLVEINGRFWGTLDHCIQAGFNVPVLACRVAMELPIEPRYNFEPGLRYRWVYPYGLLSLLRGESFRETLIDFFLPSPNTRSDLWLTDPMPTLAELIYAVRRTLDRGFRISKTPTVLLDE